MILFARTTTGGRLVVATTDPPDAEDVARLAGLCAQPGMAAAEWFCAPGDSVVFAAFPPEDTPRAD